MDINKIKNKENRIFKIYCLKDPRNLEIKYIGVTVSSLSQRLSQHIHETKNKKGTHKRNWLNQLFFENKKPIICLLEYCNYKNWEQKEKLWIKRFENLTNISKGGSGVIINRSNSIEKSAKGHWKSVIAIDQNGNIIRFKSRKEASETLKIPRTCISEVLSKRTFSGHGYHFINNEDYYEGYEKTIKINSKKNKIYFIYNDIKYSILELSNLLHCSQTLLHHIAYNRRNWKTSKFFKSTDTLETIKI